MPKIFAAACAALLFVAATAEETPRRVDTGNASAPEASLATNDETQPAATPPQVSASASAQETPEGTVVRAAADAPATDEPSSGTFDGSQYRKLRGLGGREPIGERGYDAPGR